MAITTFAAGSFSPQVDLFLDRLRGWGLDIPPMGWKRVATGEDCSGLFRRAGFTDVSSVSEPMGYHMRSADQWWEVIWNAGYRGLVSQLSPGDMAAFRKDHLEEIAALATPEGIWFEVGVIFTVGVNSPRGSAGS